MKAKLPKNIATFQKRHPTVWRAFAQLADRCHEAGPLDEKTRRLVKVALAIGAGLEGATHSAVRNALAAGVKPDEIRHVASAGDHYPGVSCQHARPNVDQRPETSVTPAPAKQALALRLDRRDHQASAHFHVIRAAPDGAEEGMLAGAIRDGEVQHHHFPGLNLHHAHV